MHRTASLATLLGFTLLLAVVPYASADCPGDTNADGDVNVHDLVAIIVAWGSGPGSAEDLDGSGQVGVGDMVLVLTGWGPCPDGADAVLPRITRLASDMDLVVPGRGIPVSVVRTYHVDSSFDGALGYGWTHAYLMHLVEDEVGTIGVFNADGTGSFFEPNGDGTYTPPAGDRRTLFATPGGGFALVDGTGTVLWFDASGRLTDVEDRHGNLQSLEYEGDMLAAVITASGTSATFAYDPWGRVSSITGTDGQSVAYDYDGNGNLRSVTGASGQQTTYDYDGDHNLIQVTYADGLSVSYTIDDADRLQSAATSAGASIAFHYGVPAAHQLTTVDALGRATVTDYDGEGRLARITDPIGRKTDFSYDADGNVASVTDSGGHSASFTYDERGNVLTATDAAGGTVVMQYDPEINRRTSLMDERGNTTSFFYDEQGSLLARVYPDGATQEFTYDEAGRLTSQTDRMGRTTSLAYDDAGRLTAKAYPGGTSATFSYDDGGRLVTASNENGTLSFAYDASGRVTQVGYPNGETLAYGYDGTGRRTHVTYPGGLTVEYGYDEARRLQHVMASGQTVATYGYNAMGNLVSRTMGNGAIMTCAYDAAAQVSHLTSVADGEVHAALDYAYGPTGELTQSATPDGTTEYAYDSLIQLASETRVDGSTLAYTYDAAGNRLTTTDGAATTTYATNELNQYLTVGSMSLSYDGNGNLVSAAVGPEVTTYAYDFDNRLVAVDGPSGLVTFTYDPFGRRLSKTTPDGTTYYFHDGHRVVTEKDEAGAVTASYVHGVWIDELLMMQRDGEEYFAVQDGQGSVVGLTGATGSLVESVSYDAYGAPESTSGVGNPYLFTGREYDAETGLYYYRARYYDPWLGRFLTPDPIGMRGGVNLYEYVANSPTNFVDPGGRILQWKWLVEVGIWLHRASSWIIANSGRLIVWAQRGIAAFCAAHDTFCGPPSDWFDILLSAISHAPRHFRNAAGWIGDNLLSYDEWPPQNGCYDMGIVVCDIDVPDGPGGGWESWNFIEDVDEGDPTFVQVPPGSYVRPAAAAGDDLTARISFPPGNSLVRANVPIFGQAFGEDFVRYRVEYGRGAEPRAWHTVATSTEAATDEFTLADLVNSGDETIAGNLATWDTGLTSYVYLPLYPPDHPVDLRGPYTVRLVVEGHDGRTVEDRITVEVGNVISNAWGGVASSEDRIVRLTVPEQALTDAFRIISVTPADDAAMPAPAGHRVAGRAYACREPGEPFVKDAVLEFTAQSVSDAAHAERMAIFGWDRREARWSRLATSRTIDGRYRASISTLHAAYALMMTQAPASTLVLDEATEAASRGVVAAAETGGTHYLSRDTFEHDLGEWSSRDGAFGAHVSATTTATSDGSSCLQITNATSGGTFAATVRTTAFDVREYPVIRFDYRVPPGVRSNILVRVSGRWYDVGFTDDPKELAYRRVNIAHIGQIENVVTDDRWHTAKFNLRDLLRTRTGHTVVDEIVMADWDVDGYMKLSHGANLGGATFYVDDFAICKETRAGLRLDAADLLIDDFNKQKVTSLHGGTMSAFVGGDGRMEAGFSEDAPAAGSSLALAYTGVSDEDFGGLSLGLGLDLRDSKRVSFSWKPQQDEGSMWLGLKDASGQEPKVPVSAYSEPIGASGWQRLDVPLVAFDGIRRWDNIESLSLSLSGAGQQRVLVDDVWFHRDLVPLVIDDFERSEQAGRLVTHGNAAINAHRIRVGENHACAITYTKDGSFSYAAWGVDLRGVDASAAASLSLRVRGAEGGEVPHLYLDDGTFRWGVDVSDFVALTTSWQTVRIPLSAFSRYGVDLTHLSRLQVVFEWERMSGTIYVDDLELEGRADDLVASSE